MIIVTYDNEGEIARCLQAVVDAIGANVVAEILVLDNGSQDDTCDVVEAAEGPVELMRAGENLGFAKGCNAAAARASGRYLLFLNPDAQVHPDCIERLLSFAASRPNAGIVGGRTIRPDGTPHIDSCWAEPTVLSALWFATGLSTAFPRSIFDPESMGSWQRDSERPVDTITGLLALISRELWEQLGGFDERFFMYSEDVDLCRRIRDRGFSPRICPDAVVVHEGGRSTPDGGRRTSLQLQGRVTHMAKHWSPPAATVGRFLLLIGVGLRALIGFAARRSSGAQRWLGAWRGRSTWLAGFPPAPPRST